MENSSYFEIQSSFAIYEGITLLSITSLPGDSFVRHFTRESG